MKISQKSINGIREHKLLIQNNEGQKFFDSLRELDFEDSQSHNEITKFIFDECNIDLEEVMEYMTSLTAAMCGGCESIVNVCIPANITHVDLGAFGYCTNLRIVDASKVKYRLSRDAFVYCRNLEHIILSKEAFKNIYLYKYFTGINPSVKIELK